MEISGPGEKWKSPIGEIPVLDYKIITHKSGKVFVRYLLDGLLDELAEDMRKNIRNDYDNVVVVEGGEGSGKSNLMYQLLRRYDPSFDLHRGYTYDADAFKKKIREGKDIGRTFWMDEGSIIANNRDWNTSQNKGFVQTLETCRSRHYTLGICIPAHERLDVYIREHRMRYLLKCEPMEFESIGFRQRGFCEVRKRNDRTGEMDLIGYAEYAKMPDSVAKEYREIKLASQEKLFNDLYGDEEGEGPGAKYKKKYEEGQRQIDLAMLSLKEAGKSYSDISEMFGIEVKTVQNRVSRARKVNP